VATGAAEPLLPPAAGLAHARRAPPSRHLGCLDRRPKVVQCKPTAVVRPHESLSAVLEGRKVW
jgi:hypothetical protein